MHLREHESITVDPVWALRVEGHEFVEEDMGNGCHAHGHTGMPGVGFEGGINLYQRTESILLCFLLARLPQLMSFRVGKHRGWIESYLTWGRTWGKAYRKGTDGVDGKLVIFSVTHNCRDILSNWR